MRAASAAKKAARLAQPDKRCAVCGETKSASAFTYDRRMERKLSSKCRACASKKHKRWCAKNKDRIRQQNKLKYAAEREKELAGAKERYRLYMTQPERKAAIRKRGREGIAKRRAKDPAAANARANAWRKANPEKMRIQWNKKRLRKLALPSDLTEQQWLEILEVHDHRCAYCLRKLTAPTKDHVIAVTRGGNDTADNIVPACQSCNSRKHNRPVFSMVNTPIRFDEVA